MYFKEEEKEKQIISYAYKQWFLPWKEYVLQEAFWDLDEFINTLPWYWVAFSINGKWIKYNIIKFTRNSKNYKIDCNSFE